MDFMKINIFFNLKGGAWGGANQFLKALKKKLAEKKAYEDNPNDSTTVIANSYHELNDLISFLIFKPDTFIIHRLGPIFYYHRGSAWRLYDKFIINFANKFADGIIFQSAWSFEEAKKLGFEKEIEHAIIHNAPDCEIFNEHNKSNHKKDIKKFTIIATSNSDNLAKGFDYFDFLDKNLDFSKYRMIFVGRSPIKFENVIHIAPQDSKNLAKILNSGDLYLSPVKNEACSNAILEALTCGLPVLGLNNSSNPEIIGFGGELFSNKKELIAKIEKIRNNYKSYQDAIKKPGLENITNQYIGFINKIEKTKQPRKRNNFALLFCKINLFFIKNLVLILEKTAYNKKNAL